MNIVHVIPTLGPLAGGANLSCRQLCEQLASVGHNVTIVATDRDPPENWPHDGKVPIGKGSLLIRLVPALWLGQKYFVSWKMISVLRSVIRDADVVHIHSLYRLHLPIAAWCSQAFGVPYIIKPHGSLDPFLFRHRRFAKRIHEWIFERRVLARAAAIHFTAEEERSLAISTGMWSASGFSEAAVVPNGIVIPEGFSGALAYEVDSSEFFARFPSLVGKRIVLFLGRLHFKKGLDLLVPAFARVRTNRSSAHLVIAGPDTDGYGVQVRRWIEREGVQESATFVGMLSGTLKWAAFKAAEVFVLPSYTENFGVAIIEAMSMGCPVVISDKVNIWREIAASEAGVVTECRVDAIAESILSVFDNEQLRNGLSSRGKALVAERYDWVKVVAEMEQVYWGLVRKKKLNRRENETTTNS